MRLKMHAQELFARNVLPAGIAVVIDDVTDNLIVHDGARAFAITHKCLDTWEPQRVVRDAQTACGDLLAGKYRSEACGVFFDLKENLSRPQSKTTFDEVMA